MLDVKRNPSFQTKCGTTKDNPAPGESVLREPKRHISMTFFLHHGTLSGMCRELCWGNLVSVLLFCFVFFGRGSSRRPTCSLLRWSVDSSTQASSSSPHHNLEPHSLDAQCRSQKQANHIKASDSIFQHQILIL